MEKEGEVNKKRRIVSPFEGFGVYASFWLWGALLFFAPNYLNITGGWKTPFIILGFIAIIISLAGMCFELGKLWRNKGLNYMGVFILFVLPALIIHLALTYKYIHQPLLVTIAKVAVLLLVAVGGATFLIGIFYLVWTPKEEQELRRADKASTRESNEQKEDRHKTALKTAATILIILLNLATAIIKLITMLIP